MSGDWMQSILMHVFSGANSSVEKRWILGDGSWCGCVNTYSKCMRAAPRHRFSVEQPCSNHKIMSPDGFGGIMDISADLRNATPFPPSSPSNPTDRGASFDSVDWRWTFIPAKTLQPAKAKRLAGQTQASRCTHSPTAEPCPLPASEKKAGATKEGVVFPLFLLDRPSNNPLFFAISR